MTGHRLLLLAQRQTACGQITYTKIEMYSNRSTMRVVYSSTRMWNRLFSIDSILYPSTPFRSMYTYILGQHNKLSLVLMKYVHVTFWPKVEKIKVLPKSLFKYVKLSRTSEWVKKRLLSYCSSKCQTFRKTSHNFLYVILLFSNLSQNHKHHL